MIESKMTLINNKEVQQIVSERVVSFVKRNKGNWQGTMTDLLTGISSGKGKTDVFPRSGAALRRVMNRLVKNIKKAGYKIEFTRSTDRGRTRLVNFTPVQSRK